jgi:hypothetical protein
MADGGYTGMRCTAVPSLPADDDTPGRWCTAMPSLPADDGHTGPMAHRDAIAAGRAS